MYTYVYNTLHKVYAAIEYQLLSTSLYHNSEMYAEAVTNNTDV